MAIRILALCAALLLPLSVCQAGVQNGGFEQTAPKYWEWAQYGSGDIGIEESQALYSVSGGLTGNYLLPHEGDQFLSLVPDGAANTTRPKVVSAFQTGIVADGWWQFEGVYALDQLYPGEDYLRISVVKQQEWDTYVTNVGGEYDCDMSSTYDLTTLWSQNYTIDTVTDGAFSQSWWKPFSTGSFGPGTYTIVADFYHYGKQTGYSVAGLDSISHTPEPSLGLLLLVGMIPVAIGFRRRRRA